MVATFSRYRWRWSAYAIFNAHVEQKFPTGLGRIGPNLDVLLTCGDGTLFAIESKFTEPYTKSKEKTYLKPEYFVTVIAWTEVGLPGCQAVAEALRRGQQATSITYWMSRSFSSTCWRWRSAVIIGRYAASRSKSPDRWQTSIDKN